MLEQIDPTHPAFPRGRVQAWQVPHRVTSRLGPLLRAYGKTPWPNLRRLGLHSPTPWQGNLIMFDWATIVGQLLSTGESNYRIGGMYLEFQNVASPGDVATPPTYDRSGGISYYEALSGSPSTDYLRVPLTAAQLTSTDATNFPLGNQQSYFAMSSGIVGVNGLPFSSVNNSVIYGSALIAFVDFADASQDLVLSRVYLATNKQQAVLPTGQVGVRHNLILG